MLATPRIRIAICRPERAREIDIVAYAYILQYINVDNVCFFVCLCLLFFVCLCVLGTTVYVFKVSMRNIMVKSAQRQLYLCTYIFPINALFTYVAYYVQI